MNHRSTAQDVYRCDLCETTIVHNYCDYCNVNLCKPCIGEHISDGYQKHAIVPFKERRSTLIYPKCATHPQKQCDLQCKDCNIFVCTSCVGSKLHKSHDVWELDDIYKTKKENIKKDAEELQNLIAPTYEEMAHDLENQLVNLDEGYEKLRTKISTRGEECHKIIDIIINKMKTEIDKIKLKHRGILQKHLDEIKEIQSILQRTADALKEIEESNELSITIEYKSKNKQFSKLPLKVKLSLPTFISKPIDQEDMNKFFGQITPLSTAMEKNVLVPKKLSNTSFRMLLDEPEIDAKIQTFHRNLSNVAYVNDERIWTSGETDKIRCFNIRGSLLGTLKTKSGEWPDDIAVDGNWNLLYSASKEGTVNILKNGQTEELIRLQWWKPIQMCVTSTDDLLVAIYSVDETQSKVVRYSGSTAKQIIQFDDEGKPLYSGNAKTKYITENRNHDICVADCHASAVVVVDQYGKKRFRYTGHASIIKNGSFNPYGIATDNQSRILIADGRNHYIHILDQNGQFLSHIYNCNLKFPWGLCVDNNYNLFVCEYEAGFVKKIKYVN